MAFAMVWNIAVVLCGFVLFQRCFTRVLNTAKELLECYQCEDYHHGNCARAYNLKKTTCFGNDRACFYKSYYDPFNNGHGGKTKYERGCTACSTEECLANATLFGIGLHEYIGIMRICQIKHCNNIRMAEFEVGEPIGIKTD